MAGQCHRSYQHEFDPTPGGSGRQEGLVCSGPWGHEEMDTTTKQQQHVRLSISPVCLWLLFSKGRTMWASTKVLFVEESSSVTSSSGRPEHTYSENLFLRGLEVIGGRELH